MTIKEEILKKAKNFPGWKVGLVVSVEYVRSSQSLKLVVSDIDSGNCGGYVVKSVYNDEFAIKILRDKLKDYFHIDKYFKIVAFKTAEDDEDKDKIKINLDSNLPTFVILGKLKNKKEGASIVWYD